eukprot:847199-Ditylum_brightwellii.AAC.1
MKDSDGSDGECAEEGKKSSVPAASANGERNGGEGSAGSVDASKGKESQSHSGDGGSLPGGSGGGNANGSDGGAAAAGSSG